MQNEQIESEKECVGMKRKVKDIGKQPEYEKRTRDRQTESERQVLLVPMMAYCSYKNVRLAVCKIHPSFFSYLQMYGGNEKKLKENRCVRENSTNKGGNKKKTGKETGCSERDI